MTSHPKRPRDPNPAAYADLSAARSVWLWQRSLLESGHARDHVQGWKN